MVARTRLIVTLYVHIHTTEMYWKRFTCSEGVIKKCAALTYANIVVQ